MVDLHEMVHAISPQIQDMRNRIHVHPELGLKEFATCALLESYIKEHVAYDSLHRVGETGLFVEIKGTRSGKDRAIIIRGDMDALPIQEDPSMVPCSEVPHVMHACGHDVHASIATGTARLLGQLKHLFSGSVYMFLQPAEEILAGAKLFLADPLIDFSKVEAAFAAHCSPEVDAGSIGVRYGGILASSDEIRMVVHGKGGHGAHCHTVIDPIMVASSIVMNLQTLVSRETNPADSAVLSICSIHGGNAHNVVPDQVELLGTVRTVNPATRDAMEASIKRVATLTAEALRASVEVIYRRCVPPLTNTSGWVDRTIRVGNALLGPEHVVMLPHPSMGGEDYAFIMEKYPGVFIRLGARTPNGPYGSMHSSTFYCDPAAIETGMLTLTGVALDYLGVPMEGLPS